MLGLLHKLIKTTLIASCVVATVFSLAQAARAGYRPPQDQKPPSGYTDSSGVRGGCHIAGALSLTLLAPVTHVGQTVSSHPTFVWFVPYDQQLPLEFTLYEFDTNNRPSKLAYKQQLQSSSGVMKLSLPQEKQGLITGKRYLWQVETLCDRDRPSHNLLVRAEIEVVQISSTLRVALANHQEKLQKVTLYAEAGLWYDAMTEALALTENGQQIGKVAASLIQDLAQ
ncbi:DUF928 domain-containing protein [Scytonema sp. UIC 10036]|nr:DUF928 domain-containing protein [Scytonema sp. UIC 10036]